MSDFIVLGIIPGTHIQITFLNWLIASLVLVVAFSLVYHLRRRQTIHYLLIRWSLFVSLHSFMPLLHRRPESA